MRKGMILLAVLALLALNTPPTKITVLQKVVGMIIGGGWCFPCLSNDSRNELDELEIAPIGLGLLACRRPPSPGVCGDLPPHLNHGFSITPLAIGGYGGRGIGMTTGLELSHQSRSHFVFILKSEFGNGGQWPHLSGNAVRQNPKPAGVPISMEVCR